MRTEKEVREEWKKGDWFKKNALKHVYSSEYSMEITKEYVELKVKHYRFLRGKKTKGQILNEVVETMGYDRKHAIRLLDSYISCKHRQGRKAGRPHKLAAEDIFFLIEEI
jgi:hypothetical protein